MLLSGFFFFVFVLQMNDVETRYETFKYVIAEKETRTHT